MNPYAKPMKPEAGQSGIVLPVVLIFMVIMMLLGVAVIRNVTLEEQMAGNSRDQQLAFEAAEEALRYCEDITTQSNGDDVGKFYAAQTAIEIGNSPDPDPRNWTNANMWGNNSYAVTVPLNPAIANNPNPSLATLLAQRPACMVERLLVFSAIDSPRKAYRVTARGVGSSAGTVVMLQSYLKPGGP